MTHPPPHPAKQPCGSCPYRKDAPSGLWHEAEYDKLPLYDLETPEQPVNAFFCHQVDGRLCAGWVGCHDMDETFAMRLGFLSGLTPEDVGRARDYSTDVPLFGSGQEARDHGMQDYHSPGARVEREVRKLLRKGKVRK
jgi:hypothetical protein